MFFVRQDVPLDHQHTVDIAADFSPDNRPAGSRGSNNIGQELGAKEPNSPASSVWIFIEMACRIESWQETGSNLSGCPFQGKPATSFFNFG